jgi:release factor glutamine methyltransferase
VRTVLAWAKGWLERRGVESPRLDAELLLAHALGCDRVRLYVEHDKPLTAEELAKVKPLLTRRAEREPVAYILGSKEFYGRPFAVGRGVFVPRPETELLVQMALEALLPQAGARALDLCAGSGAVGVTLAAERADLQVDMVELSAAAASFARRNAQSHGGGRAQVFEGDLYAPLGPPEPRYAAVVANPPYVPLADAGRLQPEITRHEPHEAIFGGPQGLDVLQKLIAGAPRWLQPGGFFGVELDPANAAEVRALAEKVGFNSVRVVQDLARLDRFVVARSPI